MEKGAKICNINFMIDHMNNKDNRVEKAAIGKNETKQTNEQTKQAFQMIKKMPSCF